MFHVLEGCVVSLTNFILLLLSFGKIHETIFDTLAFGSFAKNEQAKKRADTDKNHLPFTVILPFL